MILRNPRSVQISSFENADQQDIIIPFLDRALGDAAFRLAEVIANYLTNEQRILMAGETMSWATSVLRFDATASALSARAFNVQREVFEDTADGVLAAWDEQVVTCEAASSCYVSTQLSELAAVSPDVEDGGLVEHAARYPIYHPNSGWWFFGRGYQGDLSSIRPVHVGHVVRNDPRVARYLALEPGFCFRLFPTVAVWFEESVAKSTED
jgi:hypothetical protein